MKLIATIAPIFSLVTVLAAQDPNHAMGFDQATAVHHFLLAADGGSIEVRVKNPADTAARDRIRTHLRQIATEFSAGNFEKPHETHGEAPAGVEVMQKRRDAITYTFEEIPAGGRVRITTADATARQAIHDFLRYQIHEHHTGDPMKLSR